MADCVNEDDHCFQCDPNGPNFITIPRKLLDPNIQLKKEVGPAFPKLFNSKPRMRFTHAMPPKPDMAFLQYRRTVKKPNLKWNRKKEKRAKTYNALTTNESKWVDPPKAFSFQREDMRFQTVYVEDSPRRLLVESANHELIGIPVIETVEE